MNFQIFCNPLVAGGIIVGTSFFHFLYITRLFFCLHCDFIKNRPVDIVLLNLTAWEIFHVFGGNSLS